MQQSGGASRALGAIAESGIGGGLVTPACGSRAVTRLLCALEAAVRARHVVALLPEQRQLLAERTEPARGGFVKLGILLADARLGDAHVRPASFRFLVGRTVRRLVLGSLFARRIRLAKQRSHNEVKRQPPEVGALQPH